MGKIIAIGGGEIGRPGFPVETTKIDREIIRLTGKAKPRLLFIPTASSDAGGYVEAVKKHFGQRLGCLINVLYLINEKYDQKELEQMILGADIIYVGGGNTLKLMNCWRRLGVDKLLHRAYKQGIVLAGLSAGSICWFRQGNSDSRKFKNKNSDLIKVAGLGLIDALHCPHYDFDHERPASLKKMMKTTPGVAIALDNCCALEVVDDKFRIIKSKATAEARRVFWQKGVYYEQMIPATKDFLPLAELLKKL